MNIFRMGIHSFFLAISNVVAIIIAYGLYYFLKPANQIAFQTPIAGALSIVIFVVWLMTIQWIPIRNLIFQKWLELAWTLLLAILWIPVIFVPLHFSTQGYFTDFGNIVAIGLFQIPTNLLAMFLGKYVCKISKKTVSGMVL